MRFHADRVDAFLRALAGGQLLQPLEDGPAMYKTFRDKEDGCIKVVMKP